MSPSNEVEIFGTTFIESQSEIRKDSEFKYCKIVKFLFIVLLLYIHIYTMF